MNMMVVTRGWPNSGSSSGNELPLLLVLLLVFPQVNNVSSSERFFSFIAWANWIKRPISYNMVN